ncbi:hypothetical protein KVT40_007543 [Elsinoe batatas]|uniref:Uncharacterized protein n=1 Tax=Elsinoe batatas TaxID=2601811 RepID=A0A8K0KUX1_9PEZI|nr:hypothetical protein KVT40_007543 [Elsinoe batatas]
MLHEFLHLRADLEHEFCAVVIADARGQVKLDGSLYDGKEGRANTRSYGYQRSYVLAHYVQQFPDGGFDVELGEGPWTNDDCYVSFVLAVQWDGYEARRVIRY